MTAWFLLGVSALASGEGGHGAAAAHGAADAAHGAAANASLGDVLPLFSVLPFVGLLLSIALMPMFLEHFWHKNRNQLLVALAWAAPVFGFLVFAAATDWNHLGHDAQHGLTHAVEEYVSFIALLGSLYIISGGILLRGDLEGKPSVNTGFLAIGAIISNVVGTTGASMLLIRPMLRTNDEREHTWHIPLFFIFLVSNIGGALTPIGDPPLFLGYLRGIPFFWTVSHLWAPWLGVVVVLLAVFYFLDTRAYAQETKSTKVFDQAQIEPLALEGNINFLLLAGVIGCVLLLSPDPNVIDFRHYYARELGMVLLTVVSLFATSRSIRERNNFSYEPILEVAALFIGIFVSMIPATALLQANGDALGITEPWQYFWATGSLSSFLDNAPTYVTFAAMACGSDPSCITAENLEPLTHSSVEVLMAISLGSVFLGAGSYIGNGPNFMVRAIAEQSGYKMPSFFGYVGYAAAFLVPVFIVMTLIVFVV